MLGDSWYADSLPHVRALDAEIRGWPRPVRAAVSRFGVLRGVALFVVGRRFDTIVTTNPTPGTRTCLVLCALFRRRRAVVLEYIVHPPQGVHGVRDALRWVWFVFHRRLVLVRAARFVQVLSETEFADYPALHRHSADLFRLVRWPMSSDPMEMPPVRADRRVMASGRRVDWETFLSAASGTDWDVSIVCTAADEPGVRELCALEGISASIAVEISQDEHLRAVGASSVYVIAVPETGSSIGQIRVMNAVDAGVPMVASDVIGLHGYLDETSAVLVPLGDPTAMRAAVSGLLDDPDRRDRLRRSAREQLTTTMDEYLAELSALIESGGRVRRVGDG